MSASDWEVFRSLVLGWGERYLRRKNQEFVGLLGEEVYTPTERFWHARERMGEEVCVLRAGLNGHSKGQVAWYLFLMYRHGMIGDDNLGASARGSRRSCERRSISRIAGSPARAEGVCSFER